jgi:hypothetical protein
MNAKIEVIERGRLRPRVPFHDFAVFDREHQPFPFIDRTSARVAVMRFH